MVDMAPGADNAFVLFFDSAARGSNSLGLGVAVFVKHFFEAWFGFDSPLVRVVILNWSGRPTCHSMAIAWFGY